jgi:Fic family protein
MIKLVQNKDYYFSELDLFELHRLFYRNIDFNNAGIYRKDNVIITGATFIPPNYHKLPNLMHDFIIDLNNKKTELHLVELAAYTYLKLVAIHPFIDGNGRIARLLTNLILLNNGYRIISIFPEDRDKYINSLKTAQNPDSQDYSLFFRFIAETELKAQYEYCGLVNITL